VKVLIISGSYPPDKCGVGDYTYHLAEALAARPGIEVGVLTSSGSGEIIDSSRVAVFRAMPNWGFKSALQLKHIVSVFRPDIVHIQYPTQGYNGRLAKYSPLLFRAIRLPVVQTWHEHFIGCGAIGWPNLLACDSLIYVRPDLIQKLPIWASRWLGKTPVVYVPNASTIPIAKLAKEQLQKIKLELSGGKPIVCFFGFAHPNKGVERIFEIADPAKHHLVLICDLSKENPYQRMLLQKTNQTPWIGKVTVTGFQSAKHVGEIFAAADAVIFPFPSGAGEWNTSLKAAESAGAFTIATTQDATRHGYQKKENIYFAGYDQISKMRDALTKYIGTRKATNGIDSWVNIAITHEKIYHALCKEK
jgi:glycosyltransferase involved in cell wall biosynthesis